MERMPKLVIDVSKKEYDNLKSIWNITKARMTKAALRQLDWNSLEVFLMDLLRFGLLKASDAPVDFIRETREQKNPLFKKAPGRKKKPGVKFEEEYKKAYA